nr:FxDxF family PEP-CTERM protein [uncultured Massilia sp.]
MKTMKLTIGAMLMASVTLAYAADVEHTTTIDLTSADGVYSGAFGAKFSGGLKGKTFLDTFLLNFAGASDLDAVVTSIASGTKVDLDITSFSLYSGSKLIASSDVLSTGKLDLQTLIFPSLAAGSYALQIGGTVLGSSGGSYGGNINVSPVPEPETWGMMAGSLAVLGWLSRRRKQGSRLPDAVAA